MKGEKTKIFAFFVGKKITITMVNFQGTKARRFIRLKRNYHPRVSTFKWVRENYVSDKMFIRMLGHKAFYSLTLEDRIEIKATYMVRQHVWKSFHLWNKQFNVRNKVKYYPESDFKVEFNLKHAKDGT